MAGLARNTVIFSTATAASRIIGLVREVVAARLFGTSAAIGAFTIAFQVPNLVRSLFADSALNAAFVPVFTDLLARGERREASRLASTLALVALVVLGVVTALCVLLARPIMGLFTGPAFGPELDGLTAGLARIMFPIVLLLGLNGLLVGILNANDRFGIQAVSPIAWNLVIIAFLLASPALFSPQDEVYAYAVGVLVGTVVQLLMALPALRTLPGGLRLHVDLRDPRLRRVLRLMVPVTIGLGLVNFNQLINSRLATELSGEAVRAVDAAFRLYTLPQGVFSVAIATVVFPTLSRLAATGDRAGLRDQVAQATRLVVLLLVPAGAATLVLAEPITRLLFEGGAWTPRSTELTARALVWFSVSLPFNGVSLVLTRTFFSLQVTWTPTVVAVVSLAVNLASSLVLYGPYGISGIVAGTAVATFAGAAALAVALRRELGPLDAAATSRTAAKAVVAAAGLAAAAVSVHRGVGSLAGDGRPAQAVALVLGLTAGAVVYALAIRALLVPEAARLEGHLREAVRNRLDRRAST